MLTNSIYIRDVRVRRYSEYLADEGHQVDIVCLASEDGLPQSTRPEIRVFPLPFSRHRLEGMGLVLNWLVCAAMMFAVTTRLAMQHRYDLIHVHNMPDFLVFCALIPRLRGSLIIRDASTS